MILTLSIAYAEQNRGLPLFFIPIHYVAMFGRCKGRVERVHWRAHPARIAVRMADEFLYVGDE